ncbi:GntR family transcriptional regulator [Glutamicibacter sp. MNS18]|uniref:GntR family transcriptional regulator n=1 Tax=Glutamicibacter sp. MNS18 TaxID=2989817 RepID=UPI002235F190|nr:GntR family transcriptional regulator [Glutamicibacter sp. MNS18]MCW4464076.1 GntR family transcriptional regulator [Glutamicibacter sp. MNS18]
MTLTESSLVGLRKKSLREQALIALRRAITTGELEQGAHLVETELSTSMQISRGTLREALRQLEQEGLVSAGPRGRLSVRHLDDKEIKDIFAVRASLETLAAHTLLTLDGQDLAIAKLREAVTAMDQLATAGLEERIEADLEFHRTLCRLSGNETLLHTWEQLEGSIRMSIMFAGQERGVRNMDVARHFKLVDSIEQGDPGIVAQEIAEHMDIAASTLVGD